eukprot:CCRYP_003943-RA/>CCRYP_003943-RA protein AED:0.09 eAED:0.09 QI:0/-1/0/1/-1/1/1/0/528
MCITLPNSNPTTFHLPGNYVAGNLVAGNLLPEEDEELASFLCSFDEDTPGDFSALYSMNRGSNVRSFTPPRQEPEEVELLSPGSITLASRRVGSMPASGVPAAATQFDVAPASPFAHSVTASSTNSNEDALAPTASSTAFPVQPESRYKRRRRKPQPPGKTATHKERLFVKHNYHDLANEPDEPPIQPTDGSFKKLTPDSFPLKLHRVLAAVEDDGLAHIISWQPHGRAFLIHSNKAFVSVILPKYFPKIGKLTSVQRQLNLYGFERLTKDGPDLGAYYHEAFLRGREELSACRMVRQRVKGTGYKATSNPEDEPDFYRMPFVGGGNTSLAAIPATVSEPRENRPRGALVPPLASILTTSQKVDALRLQEQFQASRRVTNRSSSILSHASGTSQAQGHVNEETTDLFWNMWQTPEEVSGQTPTNWSNHLASVTEQVSASQRMNDYYCGNRMSQPSSGFPMQQRTDTLQRQDYGSTGASPAAHLWNNTAAASYSQVPLERAVVREESYPHHVVGNSRAFADLSSFWQGA